MKIKVLMLGWEYAPVVSGGLGVVCRSLSDSLAKSGIETTYVLPKLPNKIKSGPVELINAAEMDVEDEMKKVISIPSTLIPYSNYASFKKQIATYAKLKWGLEVESGIYGNSYEELFDEVERYGFRINKIAQNKDFDIIHAHDWMTFRAGINAKRTLKKPLVVHIHATEFDRSGGNPNKEIYLREKEGMEHADAVVAVSKYTKGIIVNGYNINPNKVIVVHNAVEKNQQKSVARFNEEDDEKIVLFIGRLSLQKGADYLLRAAQRALSMDDSIRFVFVGKGEMLGDLVELSIDLGISDNVTFAGWLNHDQIDSAYRRADLFVMPSISEPFGLTALEAIRNGTPVLLSKQSGAGEVIQNCLKVDFWDVDEMASKILAVLEHSSLSETLSEKGFDDLQKINWDKQTQMVIDLYTKLVCDQRR